MLSRPPAASASTLANPAELSPEEQEAYEAGMERVEQEKQRALSEPGPTWREWFFYDGSKWWVGLVFLIVDAWVGGYWFSDGNYTADRTVFAALSLAGAVYLELLLYRYLWRRPTDASKSHGKPFRPGWTALREWGRWTPEAERMRARGTPPPAPDGGPSADEFL